MNSAKQDFIRLVYKTCNELNEAGVDVKYEQVFDMMKALVNRKGLLENALEIPFGKIEKLGNFFAGNNAPNMKEVEDAIEYRYRFE
jgi:hypothetical protein